jgi:hypothetical protein
VNSYKFASLSDDPAFSTDAMLDVTAAGYDNVAATDVAAEAAEEGGAEIVTLEIIEGELAAAA